MMMGSGVDFFEQVFNSVTLRCDVLLANVEIFNTETGEVIACYAGIDEVQAGLRFYTLNLHPHMRDALIRAEAEIVLSICGLPGD
jgi:hypothetical protein